MTKSKTLIFDIETIGEDFDALDETSQEVMTRWIKKTSMSEGEYSAAIDDLKNRMGFSPFTGEIAAIGVLDADCDSGGVYFEAPGENIAEFEENGIKFKALAEKEILEKFWQIAMEYQEFVSFNGRCFDIPFMMIRSAIHKIRPSKNLIANRYLSSQPYNAKHIDLMDQLGFYGAVSKKVNLHMACRAFNIKSPKSDGVTGDDVGGLFKEKKFVDIARYNAGDLRATKSLYEYWREYLRF